jgi:hypothetical protein
MSESDLPIVTANYILETANIDAPAVDSIT